MSKTKHRIFHFKPNNSLRSSDTWSVKVWDNGLLPFTDLVLSCKMYFGLELILSERSYHKSLALYFLMEHLSNALFKGK